MNLARVVYIVKCKSFSLAIFTRYFQTIFSSKSFRYMYIYICIYIIIICITMIHNIHVLLYIYYIHITTHTHTHTHIRIIYNVSRTKEIFSFFFFFLFRKISQHHNKISTNDSTTVFRISSIIKSRRNFVERAASNCAVPVAYDQLMLD